MLNSKDLLNISESLLLQIEQFEIYIKDNKNKPGNVVETVDRLLKDHRETLEKVEKMKEV